MNKALGNFRFQVDVSKSSYQHGRPPLHQKSTQPSSSALSKTSEKCPVCFKLYSKQPEYCGKRLPFLLAPCDHTFCQNCLKHHSNVSFSTPSNWKDPTQIYALRVALSGIKCPFCDAKAVSCVLNRTLLGMMDLRREG